MSSWQYHERKGKQLYAQQDYTTSITHFREASRLAALIAPRKERSIILSNIVACRLKIGGIENLYASLEEAKECVSLNDKWSKAYMRLASVCIALGEHDRRHGHSNDACQALQTAIRLDPSNSKARDLLMKEMRRGLSPGTRSNDQDGDGSVQDEHNSEDANASFARPPYDDVDATWENNNNGNRPVWIQQIHDKLHDFRAWFDNLSENGKTWTKVGLGLLILYICLGGRFGLENIVGGNKDSNPYRQGSYGDGSAYERFYNNKSGRRGSESTSKRGGNRDSYSYGDSHYHDSYEYDTYKPRKSNRNRHHSEEYIMLLFLTTIAFFVFQSAGVPIQALPLGFGMRRGFRFGHMNAGPFNLAGVGVRMARQFRRRRW